MAEGPWGGLGRAAAPTLIRTPASLLAVLVVLAVLAAGAVGCGDSSDEGEPATGTEASGREQVEELCVTVRQGVQRVVDAVQEGGGPADVGRAVLQATRELDDVQRALDGLEEAARSDPRLQPVVDSFRAALDAARDAAAEAARGARDAARSKVSEARERLDSARRQAADAGVPGCG